MEAKRRIPVRAIVLVALTASSLWGCDDDGALGVGAGLDAAADVAAGDAGSDAASSLSAEVGPSDMAPDVPALGAADAVMPAEDAPIGSDTADDPGTDGAAADAPLPPPDGPRAPDGPANQGPITGCGPVLGSAADRMAEPCLPAIRQWDIDDGGGCAVLETGALHCWGYGCLGRLGEGREIQARLSPGPALLTGVRQVDRNGHVCAVLESGGLRCWGYNYSGQLGDGTTGNHVPTLAPPSFDRLTGVEAVATGGDFTCALMKTGGVRCWGRNQHGQLGDGTTTSRSSPPTTDVISEVRSLSVGLYSVCVLRNDGGVRCWGYNNQGQLGDGTERDRHRPPTADVITGVRALSTSGRYTCVILENGGLRCWGQIPGQPRILAPPATDLITGVVSVGAGNQQACAVLSDGKLLCWGRMTSGQIPEGTVVGTPTVVTPAGARQVSVALSASCALLASGLHCWGANSWGMLGDGTTQSKMEPSRVLGFCQ